MSLRTDIAAVLADDTKTDAEKRAAIYLLKVNAVVSLLQGMIGQQWIVNSITHKILAVRSDTRNGTVIVSIVLTRRAAGIPFDQADEVRMIDPPISHNGVDIDSMSAAQLAEYGRFLIAQLPIPA